MNCNPYARSTFSQQTFSKIIRKVMIGTRNRDLCDQTNSSNLLK